MDFSNLKRKDLVYLIPYLLLLALGIWFRYRISPLVFLDGDSANYLLPPSMKALTGVWHKGERPMQYLLFIYYTLSANFGVKYTIIAQQALGVLSEALLATAWVVFISQFNRLKLLWHLMGYIMLAVYNSSAVIMYYERFIGPESVCMFVMSALICVLTLVYKSNDTHKKIWFISISIFINLYLANPMPKWVFIAVFTECLLVYLVISNKGLHTRSKIWALVIPHVLYGFCVVIPEKVHDIDHLYQDRVFIEYEQMVYTHFDLLARDKTNFGLTPALQDSMMQEFNKAQKESPDFLIGFSSDYMMWGKANKLIYAYYNKNYDSIEVYFKHLNGILVTRYPWALTRQIATQVFSFYWPNNKIKKDLYKEVDTYENYDLVRGYMKSFDDVLVQHAENCKYIDGPEVYNAIPRGMINNYFISPRYPAAISKNNCCETGQLPLALGRSFWFYRWFDYLFIGSMIAFFAVRGWQRRLFKTEVVTLLYIFIFVYVLTVGIVHTFDIIRFIMTIYPFLLITTCMAMVYVANFITGGYNEPQADSGG